MGRLNVKVVPELLDDLLRRELRSSWHLSLSLGLLHSEILSLQVVTLKVGGSGRSPRTRWA
jgi:hypothetical protein